jgi:hypothetical protein
MPRSRSPLERAAGQLISAIQREWHAEIGEPAAAESEAVMHASHGLLQAAKSGSLVAVVGDKSISEFLGKEWVKAHPRVLPYIEALESCITPSS